MVKRALDIVLLGPPGAGKGTQASKLAAAFQLRHISTGDLLREEVARSTDLGTAARDFMNRGELVPDSLISRMILRWLHSQAAAWGCVFDGYPRNARQAELLDGLLAELGRRVDVALYLEVPDDVALARITARRHCESCGGLFPVEGAAVPAAGICTACGGQLLQLDEDRAEVAQERLRAYREHAEEVLSLYRGRGLLRQVDGVGERDSVFSLLRRAMEHPRRP